MLRVFGDSKLLCEIIFESDDRKVVHQDKFISIRIKPNQFFGKCDLCLPKLLINITSKNKTATYQLY